MLQLLDNESFPHSKAELDLICISRADKKTSEQN